jgi:hypothetical protein
LDAPAGFPDPVWSHLSTPPRPEHVPDRVTLCQYVPSLHFASAPFGLLSSHVFDDDAVAVVGVVEGLDFGVVAAGLTVVPAALFTPPWLEQAPLPVAVLVVPSMHVTVGGVLPCENATAGTNNPATSADTSDLVQNVFTVPPSVGGQILQEPAIAISASAVRAPRFPNP